MAGIPVQLHWSVLVVVPVFTVLIARDLRPLVFLINRVFGTSIIPEPLLGGVVPWVIGFTAVVGLFVGVFLHEVGHSVVAQRWGYEVDSITLWLLGGLAGFSEFPEDWWHELWIALAGPIVSVLVGAVAVVGFLLTPASLDPVRVVLAYLAILNLALVGFNLLPAFPLDGGRVLRALLTRVRSHPQATRDAARVGKVFAVGIGIVGLFANVFLIIVAVFVYFAATTEAKHTAIKAALDGVTVADLMTPTDRLHTVDEDTSITELLNGIDNDHPGPYAVVYTGDRVAVVTREDATAVRPVERDAYRVTDVMRRVVRTTTPDTAAMDALERISRNANGPVQVVDDTGTLVGLISKTELTRALKLIRSNPQPAPLDLTHQRPNLPGDN